MREHVEPALELARRRRSHGDVDDGFERSGDARRDGPEMAVARTSTQPRQAHPCTEHGDGRQRADLLGEGLPGLGGRSCAGPPGGGPGPAHVVAASGGFIAPFIDPELVWDFRLARVQSINASGHKYGLVYPGVGWIVWRDPDALPDDLVFTVNYLGGNMPTFALNFSRPGNQVAAQYYNFLRLGFDGYRQVQQTCRDVARYAADAIDKVGPFELITDGSELPVFAFALENGGPFHGVECGGP